MTQTEPTAAAAASVSGTHNVVIRPADADEAADLFPVDHGQRGNRPSAPAPAGGGRAPRATVSCRRHGRWGRGLRGAGPVGSTGRRSAVARRCRAASRSGGGHASAPRAPRDGPAPGIPHALCVHARPAAVRPAWLLDRAPPVGAGEDRDRLPHVRMVPALPAVRGDPRSQSEGGGWLMRMDDHD